MKTLICALSYHASSFTPTHARIIERALANEERQYYESFGINEGHRMDQLREKRVLRVYVRRLLHDPQSVFREHGYVQTGVVQSRFHPCPPASHVLHEGHAKRIDNRS